jgi:hypothetical protein
MLIAAFVISLAAFAIAAGSFLTLVLVLADLTQLLREAREAFDGVTSAAADWLRRPG